MRADQSSDVKISQIVRMRDKEGRFAEISPVGQDRAARPKEMGLMNKIDEGSPLRQGDVVPNFVGKPMGVDQHALDTSAEQQLEPIVQERFAMDRDETFRRGIGDGAKPAPHARGQQERSHDSFRQCLAGRVFGLVGVRRRVDLVRQIAHR